MKAYNPFSEENDKMYNVNFIVDNADGASKLRVATLSFLQHTKSLSDVRIYNATMNYIKSLIGDDGLIVIDKAIGLKYTGIKEDIPRISIFEHEMEILEYEDSLIILENNFNNMVNYQNSAISYIKNKGG